MYRPCLMLMTDGYKLDHRRQYPYGTEYVYSNMTARGTRIRGIDKVVWFGMQPFLKNYFMDYAQETFFSRPVAQVCDEYQRFLDGYLGPNEIGTDHIADLHSLGYLPLEIWSVPEGTRVPLRMPFFTVENEPLQNEMNQFKNQSFERESSKERENFFDKKNGRGEEEKK